MIFIEFNPHLVLVVLGFLMAARALDLQDSSVGVSSERTVSELIPFLRGQGLLEFVYGTLPCLEVATLVATSEGTAAATA
nr:eukaryotic translation initiation factor 3 subunit F-like [Ipomoea batatas]